MKSIFKNQCDCGECLSPENGFHTVFEKHPKETFFPPENDWEWTKDFFEDEIKKLCGIVVSHWAHAQWPRIEDDGCLYLTNEHGRAKIDLQAVVYRWLDNFAGGDGIPREDMKPLLEFKNELLKIIEVIDSVEIEEDDV